MNKDEMSDDDAQFEAFLRGEGDLARQLQALPQPAPSAELDGAILERARLAIVQQDRQAANDSGVGQLNNPHLARGLGMRWRVPAGIAAAVLAGLIGHQAFQQSDDMPSAQMPMDEAIVAAPEMAPAAAPPVAEVRAAEPDRRASPAAPAPQIEAVQARRAESNRRSARVVGTDAAVSERAIAVPAPVVPPPAPASAPPPPVERVTVTGSSIKRQTAEGASPVTVLTPRDMANAPPAGAVVAAKAAPVVDYRFSANRSLGQAEKTIDPAGWLAHIEALLEAEKNTEAAAEWARFRKAYPEYEVPDATQKRLMAIPKPAE